MSSDSAVERIARGPDAYLVAEKILALLPVEHITPLYHKEEIRHWLLNHWLLSLTAEQAATLKGMLK
jgi:hypothetical protein